MARVVRGSAVIRGWSNYFSIAHNYSKVANSLDHKSFWIMVNTICRKKDISTAQCLRKYDRKNTLQIHPGCSLARFRDVKMSLDYRGPRPYQPGRGIYPTDVETEADFRLTEKRRPGRADSKWQALIRDGFHCRGCGVTVTARTSHADHIEPVNRFASFQQANCLDNIQTLCRYCHRLKTHRKGD